MYIIIVSRTVFIIRYSFVPSHYLRRFVHSKQEPAGRNQRIDRSSSNIWIRRYKKCRTGLNNHRPFRRHGGYHTITGRLQMPTRALRQTSWVARVWRLVWTARALGRLLIRCSVPHMEDIIIGGAHQRCQVHSCSRANALSPNKSGAPTRPSRSCFLLGGRAQPIVQTCSCISSFPSMCTSRIADRFPFRFCMSRDIQSPGSAHRSMHIETIVARP